MVINLHWTTLVVSAIAILTVVAAYVTGKPDGDYDISPLFGCMMLMLGALLITGFLLVHAWGWL